MYASKNVTVILPCAGEGTRLGLTTPKELYEIIPGTRLIDFSLEHIRYFSTSQRTSKLSVVVVTRPWKIEVADYVSYRLPGIAIETMMFNDRYFEWPGSVYSANPMFSDFNIVLLPDSFIGLSRDLTPLNDSPISWLTNMNGKSLIELMIEKLSIYHVIFGNIECKEPKTLSKLGAMKVKNGLVTLFQDKPKANYQLYNCFWGCYGFRKEYGEKLYDFLLHSVQHQSLELESQSFYPPGAVPIASYYDLGTWDNIARFKLECQWLCECQKLEQCSGF